MCFKNQKYSKSKKQSDDEKIYPLYPKEDLTDNSVYCVYQKKLNAAFSDRKIHNIAVTGNFGIGKSSVLRAFSKHNNKKFLYISFLEFNKIPCFSSLFYDEKIDRQKVECLLVKQIISVCHSNDFPQSKFQMVRESKHLYRKCFLSVLLTAFILCVFCLVFPSQVSEFFHYFKNDISFHSIHMAIYVFVGVIGAILSGLGIYQLLKKGKIKELSASINNSNSEIAAKAEFSESILEQYSFDLIYMFEKLSKKYSAVVFEDMDRLNDNICIDIFTGLRNINFSVNERLSRKKCINRNKSIPFIYVVNDSLMGKLNQTKFFDYIMPIIPQLGYENIIYRISEICRNFGIENVHAEPFCELAKEIPELIDYRFLNQMCNEYSIISEIVTGNLDKSSDFELISSEKAKLLAFVIYKLLLPEDYYEIRTGKSVIFPVTDTSKLKNKKNQDKRYRFIDDLQSKGFLMPDCMKFLGYSKSEKIDFCRNALKSDDISYKRKLLLLDNEFVYGNIYQNYPEDQKVFVNGIQDLFMLYFLSYNDSSAELLYSFLSEHVHADDCTYTAYEEEIYRSFVSVNDEKKIIVLKYFILRNIRDFNWLQELIDNDDTREDCYRVLDKLSESDLEYVIEQIKPFLVRNSNRINEYTKLYNCLMRKM